MRLHRRQTDEQLVRDFLIRQPPRDFDQHLALAVGKLIEFRIGVCGLGRGGRQTGTRGHPLDQAFGSGWRDDRIALVYRADRAQQRLRFGILQQEPRSSGIDRRHHIFIQIECRQNDHLGTGDF